MKVGTLLIILHNVIEKITSMGLLSADGNMQAPTPVQDAELASFVEQQLKAQGVVVQDNVDKVINMLPGIFALVGLK